MTLETLRSSLESIQGHIRAFDSKAQVLLGVNGVLAGFITTELGKFAEFGLMTPKRFAVLAVLLGLSVSATLVAFLIALRVLNPQLHLKQPSSKFFFCHLAAEYGQDYKRAAADLVALSDPDASLDVSQQILVNSIICDVKAKRCKWGMRCTGLALLLYATSIPIFMSMAYAVRTPQSSTVQLPSSRSCR